VFRLPVSADFVAGAKLMYMTQRFDIAQQLPNGAATDLPSVQYGAVEPRVFAHYSITPSITANVEGAFMFVTRTGPITADTTGYGGAKDLGFEFNAGVDYNLTKAIFARALIHFEEFSMTFKGDMNSLANTRDNNAATQDVFGAKDYYYGAAVQIGYIY
jgi:hypothetical protein